MMNHERKFYGLCTLKEGKILIARFWILGFCHILARADCLALGRYVFFFSDPTAFIKFNEALRIDTSCKAYHSTRLRKRILVI